MSMPILRASHAWAHSFRDPTGWRDAPVVNLTRDSATVLSTTATLSDDKTTAYVHLDEGQVATAITAGANRIELVESGVVIGDPFYLSTANH